MRLWFSAHSDVPLYRQLVTQVQLAILSGDLRPGDRLPSTRELARRFAIHPNTVSAGYRELEREGWTELRHGSGVYVCDLRAPQTAEARVDAYIGEFFRRAHELGLSASALRSRMAEWVAAPAPDHWLLVDPDTELRQILLFELRAATDRDVRDCSIEDCNAEAFAGAMVCCRPSQESLVRAVVPTGVELVVLPITSANQWLVPWMPAPQGLLVAVVSHWPEFLDKARTMLAAAAVPAEALIFCDARKSGWRRGVADASGVLCDAYTASAAKLPKGPQRVIFPLLAANASDFLEQAWLWQLRNRHHTALKGLRSSLLSSQIRKERTMQTESRIAKERIPWLMAGTRAVLGPMMILGERARWNGITLAALIVAALLSDIFDGVLARKWKCDTPGVRLFDSMADIVFYVGCAIALWMRHPGVLRGLAVPIAAVIGLEVLCLAVAFVKFGKLPSYHSYLAKTWGLVLASALVAAFLTKHPSGWIVAALVLGALSNLEGLAMSLIMPVWRQDVKTLAVAWRLRGIAQRGGSRLIPKIMGAAVLMFAVAALPLHAQKSGEAIYETGTSQIAANTIAPMITTAEGLRFEASTPLVIPYEKIAKVGFRKDVREHLGFFPAMFAGMFFARVHIYRVTLSYYDDAQKEHAAVFQVTRDDSITLSELLRARAPACRSSNDCKLPWDE